MIVLTLDPGATSIGWSVLEFEENTVIQVLDFGVFSPPPHEKSDSFSKKSNDELVYILQHFSGLYSQYNITHVVWEIVPMFGQMAQNARIIAAASFFKCLCFQRELPFQEYTPREIKKKATGNAKAEKFEMREEVYRRFPTLPVISDLPWDAYDAILVGVVGVEQGQWRSSSVG